MSWAVELRPERPRIHVVAGVLEDADGRVLIAQRPAGRSLAGAWEFPGGKLLAGEERFAGLARELEEELGIRVPPGRARPLIRYLHRHPDLEIELDAWRVLDWEGEPQGLEQQAVTWRQPDTLLDFGLLPADAAIVRAITLPSLCLVTPPNASGGEEAFLDSLEDAALAGTAGLICLRRPDLDADELLALASGAACRVEGSGARLLLHGDPALLGPVLASPPASMAARFESSIAGLHVPARYLSTLRGRPVPATLRFGASCHDAEQLAAAHALDADYAFLGPVKSTASHPGEPGLGWEKFAHFVMELPMPVYAIGGLGPGDLETAWAAGAQGIAAIRGLWPG
ncbi:MAG: Nudix family hydrolase [Gammaproteobacteria bacterium]